MRYRLLNRYTRLTHVLALLLCLTTACGPLSLTGRHQQSHGSRLAGDDDDPDDEDESTHISQLEDDDLGRSETQLAITTDPSIDGQPYVDPGYTGTCDSKAMCLEISSDSPSDQEDSGDRSDGDGRDRQGAVATASPDDDWIKSDDLDSKINELKLRAKRFLEDNAGNKDLSKQERAKSPIPATPLQINPHDYPFATPVASGDGQRLARAWQYEKTVGDLINANADTTQPQHQVMSAADASLRRADAAFQGGDRASAEFTLQLATTALDVALDGGKSAWARNTFEGLTGRNADDHSKLSYFMQAAGLVVMIGEVDAAIAASAVVVPAVAAIGLVSVILANTDLIKHDVDQVIKVGTDLIKGTVVASDLPPIIEHPLNPPAVPGGKVDESAGSFSQNEKKIADMLANEGKVVVRIPESNVNGDSRVDATVDGKQTEFKTLKPESTVGSLVEAIKSGAKQGDPNVRNDIIVDVSATEISFTSAKTASDRINDNPKVVLKPNSVRIIGRDYDFTQPF